MLTDLGLDVCPKSWNGFPWDARTVATLTVAERNPWSPGRDIGRDQSAECAQPR